MFRRIFVSSLACFISSLALFSAASTANQHVFPLHAENNTPALQVQSKIVSVDIDRAIPDQYIVVLDDNSVNQELETISDLMSADPTIVSAFRQQVVEDFATQMATAHRGQVKMQFHNALSGFVVNMSQQDMINLAKDDRVAFIEQDQIMQAVDVQTNATWGLDRIDQPDLPLDTLYHFDERGIAVTAYIIDTGIMSGHSDFNDRVLDGFSSINDNNGTEDCHGHGTHVAGTVGSATWGVAKDVALIPIRVLGCDGSGTNSGVISGVDWVTQNAVLPAVGNMSLGGGSSTALDNAVKAAVNAGITMVVAAGNSNADACNGSPNRVTEAITVAASTSSDARASYSNHGSCVDMFAPGSSITSTWNDGGSNTISGTSMAAPHVAGAVALYLEQNRDATPLEATTAIKFAAAGGRISNANGSPNLLLQTRSDVTPPPPPPGDNVLENGVPVNDLSASTGEDLVYTMEVPDGATDISFSISGGSGDADLYVKFGSKPTDSSYDCRPYSSGNNETCSGSSSGGKYYVRVKAYSSFSGLTLKGSYTEPGTGPTPIDISIPGISVSSGEWDRYYIDLDAGYSKFIVSISGGAGDADLYVNFGSQSSTSNYDCRPYKSTNNETCTFSSPDSGRWHIDIRGYRRSYGITLRVQAQP